MNHFGANPSDLSIYSMKSQATEGFNPPSFVIHYSLFINLPFSKGVFTMKQSYTVPVRLSEDLLRKLIYLSEAEGRTPQAQFTLMLRNTIQYHERAKSKIPPAELAKIDITPYMDKAPDQED